MESDNKSNPPQEQPEKKDENKMEIDESKAKEVPNAITCSDIENYKKDYCVVFLKNTSTS